MEKRLLNAEINGSWALSSHWYLSLILSRAYENLPYDFLHWTAKYSFCVHFQMSTWFLHSLQTKTTRRERKEAVTDSSQSQLAGNAINMPLCFRQAWTTNSICLKHVKHSRIMFTCSAGSWVIGELRSRLITASYVRCCLRYSNNDPAFLSDHIPNNVCARSLSSHQDEEWAAGTPDSGTNEQG